VPFSDRVFRRRSKPCAESWCRRIAEPPDVSQRCLMTTSASETARLDIHECAVGPGGRAEGGSVAQNRRLCGCRSLRYVASNCDAGVPPPSFFSNGSRERLLCPKLISP